MFSFQFLNEKIDQNTNFFPNCQVPNVIFGITVNFVIQKLNTWFVSVFSGDSYFWGNERKYFTHIPGPNEHKNTLCDLAVFKKRYKDFFGLKVFNWKILCYFQKKMDANPWLVENIQTFSFLNCPECTFKSKGVVTSESIFNLFLFLNKCTKPLALTFHLQVNHFQRVPFVQHFIKRIDFFLKKGQPLTLY